MKKYLAIFIVVLMFVLLVTSISKFVKVAKPFYETDEEETTVAQKKQDLELENEIQIEDFILSVSDDFGIALKNDEVILVAKKESEMAKFELYGAYVKKLILITNSTNKEFEPGRKSETFIIPIYLDGEKVKSVIAFIESSESGEMEIIIRSQ